MQPTAYEIGFNKEFSNFQSDHERNHKKSQKKLYRMGEGNSI